METRLDISKEPQKKQKYLGNKGLIALITFLSAFIPLSTDLYLPALPSMAANLNTTDTLVNFTLISFFIFYAGATLFWGPLSDRYGRKPILLTGLIIYTTASVLCAFSGSIYQLITFRILQAFGSGAATSVGTAIVKDSYSGRNRESVLALVQSMVMLSPVVAPVIGALVLNFTSWRGVFAVLAFAGLAALLGGIALEETIGIKSTGNIFQSISNLMVVAKNPGFTTLLFTFSIASVSNLAFVSTSSYIYVDGFGLSEQAYSYFFAVNALFLVLGPLLYVRVSKFIKRDSIITASYIVTIISGLLVCTIGRTSPWVFALCLIPASLSISIIRPPSTNLMLEQQKENTGSASSLISCTYTAFGALGMLLMSLNSSNRIMVLGLAYSVVALISLILWLANYKKGYIRQIS